jgi:hypothetical protein
VAPPALARERVGDRHALRLPRCAEDHISRGDLPDRDTALELRRASRTAFARSSACMCCGSGPGDILASAFIDPPCSPPSRGTYPWFERACAA